MKILITGGTGLVGTALTKLLRENDHEIVYLSRSSGEYNGIRKYRWDYKTEYIDPECLQGVDAIVHLAGAGVADKRWTTSRKKVIIDSRVKTTTLLRKLLNEHSHQVKTIVSASAIGYYGTSETEEFDESSAAGNDYLAHVTEEWEKAVDQLQSDTTKVAKIRIGLVLSEKGGALKQLLTPIKFGVGSPLGSGEQMMSWIHIDDLARMFKTLLDNPQSGVYNGVANHPVSNAKMSRTIADVLNKPFFFPKVPSFVLKIILGEMAEMVLQGSVVRPKRFLLENFSYKHDELEDALRDLLLKG